MRAPVPVAVFVLLAALLAGCLQAGSPGPVLAVATDAHAWQGRALNLVLVNEGDAPLMGDPVVRILDDTGRILHEEAFASLALAPGETRNLTIPVRLPWGAHHAVVTLADQAAAATFVVAPVDALRVTTDRAAASTRSAISVILTNEGDFTWTGAPRLTITHAFSEAAVHETAGPQLTLRPGAEAALTWNVGDADPGPYLAQVTLTGAKEIPGRIGSTTGSLRGQATFEVTP